jgi:hypothetical protein
MPWVSPTDGGPGNPDPVRDDERAILHMLLPRAQGRIDGQLRDSDALDSKALGVLALDAAAIALLVAVREALGHLWWIPSLALGLAGVFLLAAVWPRHFDLGPDTRAFYERMRTSTELVALRQMLAELLAAIEENDARTPDKGRLFKVGFALVVIGLLGALAVAVL